MLLVHTAPSSASGVCSGLVQLVNYETKKCVRQGTPGLGICPWAPFFWHCWYQSKAQLLDQKCVTVFQTRSLRQDIPCTYSNKLSFLTEVTNLQDEWMTIHELDNMLKFQGGNQKTEGIYNLGHLTIEDYVISIS